MKNVKDKNDKRKRARVGGPAETLLNFGIIALAGFGVFAIYKSYGKK